MVTLQEALQKFYLDIHTTIQKENMGRRSGKEGWEGGEGRRAGKEGKTDSSKSH